MSERKRKASARTNKRTQPGLQKLSQVASATKTQTKRRGGRNRAGSSLVAQHTTRWQAVFLDTLRASLNVSLSAQTAGVARQSAYDARERDPLFALAWERAIAEALDTAEGELFRRAVQGVDEPVFYQGEVTGYVRKYSDTLLAFLLRSHRPGVYGQTVSHQHSWQQGVIQLLAEGRITPAQVRAEVKRLGLGDDPEARMLLERISATVAHTTYTDEAGEAASADVLHPSTDDDVYPTTDDDE